MRPVTRQSSVLLAPNPGPMTLDGTNSYVLRGEPGQGAIIVDPGPDDHEHLSTLAAAGPVDLILITHQHGDHTDGIDTLHELTGAPVRAALAEYCRAADPLTDNETITVGDVRVRVLATPGHSADSVCFVLPDDGPLTDNGAERERRGSVLTGDTILGAGSTVIGIPDGTLRQYLASLERLAAWGSLTVLPAHGPTLPDVAAISNEYLAHRRERLGQIRTALSRLGVSPSEADVDAVTDAVYPEVDRRIRFAAQHSVAAQLAYLREE